LFESHVNPDAETATRWEGLRKRVISGVILAKIVLLALWLGGWIFTLLVVAAATIMIREWDMLTADDHPLCKVAGIFYVGIPCASLIWLRNLSFPDHTHGGAEVVLFVMLCVWATDIGAYFTGRRVGGPKLAPSISPNKTWAGLGGGVVCAAIVGGICTSFSPYPPSIIAGIDLGILLALVSQGGDLFESWLKRRVGAKDSGTLIPGHGGLLDRVDGMIFALPAFALLLYMTT
jgi:phosphatidate cytidylyltransferase